MGNSDSIESNGNNFIKIDGSLSTLKWSFIDYTGFHQISLLHDIFTGSRIIYHNKQEILNIPSVLIDDGSTHNFIFPELKRSNNNTQFVKNDFIETNVDNNNIILNEDQATPVKVSIVIENATLQFNYKILVNNINIIDYNRKLWTHLIYWQFRSDDINHIIAVIEPFVLIVDGIPFHHSSLPSEDRYTSEFSPFGSFMSFSLGNCPINLLHFVVKGKLDTFAKSSVPNLNITFPPVLFSKDSYPYQLYVNGILIPAQSVGSDGLPHLGLGR